MIYEIYRDTSPCVKGWFPFGLPLSQNTIDALELSDYYTMDKGIRDRLAMLGLRARAMNLTSVSDVELFGSAVLYNAYRYMLGVWTTDKTLEVELTVARAQAQVSDRGFEEAKAQFSSKYPPHPDFDSPLRFVGETLLLKMALSNPAFQPLVRLFGLEGGEAHALHGVFDHSADAIRLDENLENHTVYQRFMLPIAEAPTDLKAQLRSVAARWGSDLPSSIHKTLLHTVDLLNEAQMPRGGPGPMSRQPPLTYMHPVGSTVAETTEEYFTPDRDWMSEVVLMAKQTYVWLAQLTAQYGRKIDRLDHIPDAELERLSSLGFTGLWLIGLWSRSKASRTIKVRMGNPEAIASAYALDEYSIAEELGGTQAYEALSHRALKWGIRLAADMVPNHVGIDGKWLREHPERFVQTFERPYENYRFDGPDLSEDPSISVFLEDGYYQQSDAAVVFKRVDNSTGDVRYIYHGNDGTQMPWNDTAQLDYLNPQVREYVIQEILSVARRFPIIRFDAAMTLAKKHIQRLWYPKPGHGGAIPSRAVFGGRSEAEFEAAIPQEFWREVVDRINAELPDTLLLAEAFWMMEGYFVRDLGMHRVYNSAFMNMLKGEHNADYRATIKNTLAFSPEVLKRFVNFMNNPDEETAVAQFGKDSKYLGNVIMMVTMPGLPMFGHGQIEGFEEKYGMEYQRPCWDESIDTSLVDLHQRCVAPLMHQRHLFSDTENFELYDFVTEQDQVNENVFAYTNRCEEDRALVIFNNSQTTTSGYLSFAVEKNVGGLKATELVRRTPLEGLALDGQTDTYYACQNLITGTEHVFRGSDFEPGIKLHTLGEYQIIVLRGFTRLEGATEELEELCERVSTKGVVDLNRARRLVQIGNGTQAWIKIIDEALIGEVSSASVSALYSDSRFAGLLIPRTSLEPRISMLLSLNAQPPPVLNTDEVSDPKIQRVQPLESKTPISVERSLISIRVIRTAIVYSFLTDEGSVLLSDALKERISPQFQNVMPALSQYLFSELGRDPAGYFERPEVCEAIGVHQYEGVSWFSQEPIEILLNLMASVVISGLVQSDDRLPLESLRQLVDESAYRYNDFIFLLRRAEVTGL